MAAAGPKMGFVLSGGVLSDALTAAPREEHRGHHLLRRLQAGGAEWPAGLVCVCVWMAGSGAVASVQ